MRIKKLIKQFLARSPPFAFMSVAFFVAFRYYWHSDIISSKLHGISFLRLCLSRLCHVLRASNLCRPNHSTNPGPTTALATSRDHSPNVRTGLQWQHPNQLSVSRPCPSFSKPQAGRPRPQISLDQDTAPEPWRSANLGLALTLA